MIKGKINGETVYLFYAHLSDVSVKNGECLKEGHLVGQTGNSGNASNLPSKMEHLHFEILNKPIFNGTDEEKLKNRKDPFDYIDFIEGDKNVQK